jgi:hypothetical protein
LNSISNSDHTTTATSHTTYPISNVTYQKDPLSQHLASLSLSTSVSKTAPQYIIGTAGDAEKLDNREYTYPQPRKNNMTKNSRLCTHQGRQKVLQSGPRFQMPLD